MVLVILAILAAILVPALLGYIDKAREKQYVLDARSVYMATQAVVDEYYAKNGKAPSDTDLDVASIKKLADTDFGSIKIDKYATRTGAGSDTALEAEIEEMTITNLKSGTATVTMKLTTADGWKKVS